MTPEEQIKELEKAIAEQHTIIADLKIRTGEWQEAYNRLVGNRHDAFGNLKNQYEELKAAHAQMRKEHNAALESIEQWKHKFKRANEGKHALYRKLKDTRETMQHIQQLFNHIVGKVNKNGDLLG